MDRAAEAVPPRDIEEIENIFIPLPDGIALAARIWLPAEARRPPRPAVLEYIPYRKRDFMRQRDEPIHRYFASSGYVSVRVDVRGSGDSGGILRDEYSPAELDDALHVIAWIASQPWCDGNVGMMGISWGGFNALQVAASRPPALKAVISLCAADDRYTDDAHYMGGCLLNENLQWGTLLMLNTALPPDPEIVGERWREMWRRRLEHLEPFPARWMSEQWRSEFWKHGSVREDFAAIKAPVYLVGGWADGYSNAIPRLMAGLKCPRKALIGPWAHTFPQNGIPGPAIGFLQEAVRWWDHWLKGRDTGLMDEPAFRAWMQEWVEPAPQYDVRPGRWVAEEGWPSVRIASRRFHLNHGRLAPEPSVPVELSFSSPQTTGVRSGEWCAFGTDGEMPRDQRSDDGGSLIFDSDPLEAPLEILGAPVVEIELRCDKPVALLAVRLCDIAPDGSSLRTSYGLLNLTHRRGHEAPTGLTPGEWTRVRVQLNDIAYVFAPGHLIRVALSTSYWPIAWPAPEAACLSVRTGMSTLDLPVRPRRPGDERLREFGPPVEAPATTAMRRLRPLAMRRTVEIDLATNEMIYRLISDGGDLGGASLAHVEDIELDIGQTVRKQFRIVERDPLSARAEMQVTTSLERGDWRVRLNVHARLTSSAETFHFAAELEAFEGGAPFITRDWTLDIPRKLV